MTPLLSPADDQITDEGAAALADGIRANKKNGGKLALVQFQGNRMTDAGMTAMAEAMHAAGLETTRWTPAKVKEKIAALVKQDNAETTDLSGTTAKIEAELGQREFTEKAIEYRNEM